MKLSDPKKAAASMIYDALNRVDELLTKYTGENWAEICTPHNSPTNLTGLPNDEILKECLFFSQTAAEAFVIGFGAVWPDNNILRVKLINLRSRWIDFIEKDTDLYLSYLEFHYLNRILSNWESNLGIDKSLKNPVLENKKFAWHYALALVLLQKSGSLELTIGKKSNTITQAINAFDVSEDFAKNIYDGTKKMKSGTKNDKPDWDIDYFFSTYAPKNFVGYKEIVRKLLKNDEDAINILENLPD